MEIENTLTAFIVDEVMPKDAGPAPAVDEQLVASGRIDSLGLLQILGFIQQRWNVDLMASGGPDDFVSVASMAAAIRRHSGVA